MTYIVANRAFNTYEDAMEYCAACDFDFHDMIQCIEESNNNTVQTKQIKPTYITLDELTHEQQMIEEYGDTFFFFDHEYTSDGKQYMSDIDAIPLFINAIPNSIQVLKLTDKNKRYAIVSRSAKEQGHWQASYFDNKGAYADSIRVSRNETIQAALENGFQTIEEWV